MALEKSKLSPGELIYQRTPTICVRNHFYRLLKAHDPITRPTYVMIKPADQFQTKTTRQGEMWQAIGSRLC